MGEGWGVVSTLGSELYHLSAQQGNGYFFSAQLQVKYYYCPNSATEFLCITLGIKEWRSLFVCVHPPMKFAGSHPANNNLFFEHLIININPIISDQR